MISTAPCILTLRQVAPLFATAFFHNLGSQYAGLLLALIASLLSVIPWAFYKYGYSLRRKSAMADCPEDNIKRSSSARLSVKMSRVDSSRRKATRMSVSY